MYFVKKAGEKSVDPSKSITPPTSEHEYAYEKSAPERGDDSSILEKNEPNIPKSRDYFTYDSLGSLEADSKPESVFKDKKDLQESDNEGQSKYKLTLSEEEIYKGFIYSEILKRRVN